ncbi:hypothetical protein EVAR_101558_1, partial [Eumeta japonica]
GFNLSNVDSKADEESPSSPEKIIDSPTKVENIKSPIKDDIQDQKETSSTQQKVCESEEYILDKRNEKETSSETENVKNIAHDQIEICDVTCTETEDHKVIAKECEIKETFPLESEKESDEVSKAVTTENVENLVTVGNDNVEKSVKCSSDDINLALESHEISNAMECEDFSASTKLKSLMIKMMYLK